MKDLPRVEPAHVMVAFHPSVHDCSIPLLADPLSSDIVIYPIWISPTGWIYRSKFNRSACIVGNSLFECRIERVVIKEHIWVVEPPIEMPLYRLHGLYDSFQFLIPRQHHERCISTRTIGLRFETASDKDLVVFLTNLPIDTGIINIRWVTVPLGLGKVTLLMVEPPQGSRCHLLTKGAEQPARV